MKKEYFGTLQNQEVVSLYTIENSNYRLSVLDYGFTIQSFYDKKLEKELVVGFKTMDHYESNLGYIGKTIGRIANRIDNASFQLNDKTYSFEPNENTVLLHGGPKGIHSQMWQVECEEDTIIGRRLQKEEEDGFPGDISICVKLRLCEDGIRIENEAISNQDTYFDITNHSYFTLGCQDVRTFQLQVNADMYAHVNNVLIPVEMKDVTGSAFDFRSERKIQDGLDKGNPQFQLTHGYDHFFLIRGEGMREMVKCKTEDYTFRVYSDLPGLQIYTANQIDQTYETTGIPFHSFGAICFETQHTPNAMNDSTQKQPFLKKDQIYKTTTEYRLKRNGE